MSTNYRDWGLGSRVPTPLVKMVQAPAPISWRMSIRQFRVPRRFNKYMKRLKQVPIATLEYLLHSNHDHRIANVL